MPLRFLLSGFAAGLLAVPTFHQLTVWGLYNAGLVMNRPFSFRPEPPFDVPRLLSISFWGGVWGVLVVLILLARPRLPTVMTAVAVGVLGAATISMTLAPALRGHAMPILDPERWWRPVLINGMWGLGTGLILASLRGRLHHGDQDGGQ
ncbi:MAG TPA: hypothetical protein VGM87_03600 [Roseomonas sp.]|jgi:hypothetical protein